MNKLVVTAQSLLLSFTTTAVLASEEVHRTVDAAPDGHVDVSNVSGEISVEGWSRDSVEVAGTIGRNVKELIVERDGDKVLIKVKIKRHGGSGNSADLEIKIPENSSLNVGTVSADIDVETVLGEQGLHTVSGDVRTEIFADDLQAESVSGDVDVTGHGKDSEIDATSVSGDVRLENVAGEVEVVAVSGDLDVVGGSFDRVRMESVNGEIFFESELRADGRLDVDTVNGDVDIVFSRELSGRFDIDTFNGDIDNCFGPDPERTSKYAPGLELEFTLGEGDARVNISTLNGDIDICD